MADLYAQLRPASFRGFAFDIPADTVRAGRRVQTSQFPGRDEPLHEDLGLDLRQFTVEAIIHGPEFRARADGFENVLLTKGPGSLIHPHFGEMDVIVKGHERSHADSETGVVRFSVTFEKYGAPLVLAAGSGSAEALSASTADVFGSIEADFIKRFSVADLPAFISGDALGRVESYVSNLRSGLGNLAALLEFPTAVLDPAATLAGQMRGLFEGIAALAKPFKKPALSFKQSPTANVNALALANTLSRASQLDLSQNFTGSAASISTRTRNAQALDLMMRGNTLAAAVSSSRYANYGSREEALAFRRSMVERIAALRDAMAAAEWDDSTAATGTMAAALSRDISERLGRLPYTVRIQTRGLRPSVVLSHRIYGDNLADVLPQAGDIVTRNRVRHPGMVPAGDLEVLLDAS